MTNEKKFYELCKIMSHIEDIIKEFEKLGFMVEPDKKNPVAYKLYDSASTACNVAIEFLQFTDIETENSVCNELFAAGSESIEEISKRIWNEYGIK